MKKNFIPAIISVIAAIICVAAAVSIIYIKKEPMSFDLMAGLVGILSLLVTALIGWQIFNFIFIKQEVSKLIKEEIEYSFRDFNHILKGVVNVSNSKAFFMGMMPQALDDNMIALESILQSKNQELILFALDVVMNNLNEIKKDMEAREKVEIWENRKPKYLFLLEQTNHPFTCGIINVVNKAVEIENDRNNHIRVFNASSGDLNKLKAKGVVR